MVGGTLSSKASNRVPDSAAKKETKLCTEFYAKGALGNEDFEEKLQALRSRYTACWTGKQML